MISRRHAARPLVILLAILTSAACRSTEMNAPQSSMSPSTSPAPSSRPNIVFVLADDLSMNLLPYMPNVAALAAAGTTFSNYTVTDSLCCPSRASILAGRFPHNTGIFKNHGKYGGFEGFHGRNAESSTFATSLQQVGYRTAMMGKYLNGYVPKEKLGGPGPYVPPGWSEWAVGGNAAYDQYGYNLNENGKVRNYGHKPGHFLNSVLTARASSFITASAAARTPFMIEVASYAPHAPFTAAPQDVKSFKNLKAPRGPAFNTVPTNAPPWLAGHKPLTAAEIKAIDKTFRKRVQSVQSLDRMVASLRKTLTKAGVADNTVVIFSSDNGFHTGEYRLNPGKMTAFDTDVHVPLIVAGPGVKAGQTVTAPAENIDLRPTFEDLAGAPTPPEVDGHSLRPLLAGASDRGWRTAALVEHHGAKRNPADPDDPAPGSGNPPTYAAMRTVDYTYVEYLNGSVEYYDRRNDPHQMHNLSAQIAPDRLAQLRSAIAAMTTCQGQAACWAAAHQPTPSLDVIPGVSATSGTWLTPWGNTTDSSTAGGLPTDGVPTSGVPTASGGPTTSGVPTASGAPTTSRAPTAGVPTVSGAPTTGRSPTPSGSPTTAGNRSPR